MTFFRCPVGLGSAVSLWHQSQALKKCSLCQLHAPSCGGGATSVATACWQAGLPLAWLWGSAQAQGWVGSQWVCLPALTGWGKSQNDTYQYWRYQGSLRLQKCLPLGSQSLGSILTHSLLSSRCFKISKWIPSTYSPSAFQSDIFVLLFRSSSVGAWDYFLSMRLLRMSFSFSPYFFVFIYLFFLVFLAIFFIGFQKH